MLHRRYIKGDPERLAALEEARQSAAIARDIYELQTRAGLTQAQLAERVEVTVSVIDALEEDDYEEVSVSLLSRIAAALGQGLEVRFVPKTQDQREGNKESVSTSY
jgi:transcriptional regulator with XRE-family HTH domain